jgi:ribonucleoside-diphosphate reductase alpha chain
MQPIDTESRERTDARVESSVFSADADTSATASHVTMSATAEAPFALTPPHNPGQMRVTKRNGGQEIVDVNKIVRAVTRSAEGLHAVDPLRVALKTIGGLYDGASTQELDQLSIRTAAALTAEEP